MYSNLIIREIQNEDYNRGYLDLMYEFTNYKKNLSEEEFSSYIDNIYKNNTAKILVIIDPNDNKIIGAGTIFKIDKLHNNSVGQIEDVIISEKYRNLGLGKILIKKLVNIGIYTFNAYKVILNCLEKNIGFYEKSNFKVVGVEMKYLEN